jgi:4-hydroxybenzoate polyprenyltransferase
MIGIEHWYYYGLFAFFSTLAVYNGQRLYKASSMKQTPWLEWVTSNRTALTLLSALSAIGAVIFLFLLPEIKQLTWIVLGVSGAVSTFYVVKIRGTNMRQIPHLKIHLIALSWSAVLILFPMINSGKELDAALYLVAAHYVYVLAMGIPFDIRDLKYDLPSQRTIPQVIGVIPAKLLSLLLMSGFAVMILYFDQYLMMKPYFLLSVIVPMLLVVLMNRKRSDMYCAGLIDGSIALLGLAYLMA